MDSNSVDATTHVLLFHLLVPRCIAFAAPADGSVSSIEPDYANGSILMISCHAGYDLVGDEHTRCTSDGNNKGVWSPNPSVALCGK